MKNISNSRITLTGLVGGVFVGFLNGFFGGGGGMLVISLLIFLLKIPEKKAHATAIFVILPLSVVSSVIYILKGSVDYANLLYCSIGFVIGGTVGALLLKKLKSKWIRIIFSLIMMGAGIKMLF